MNIWLDIWTPALVKGHIWAFSDENEVLLENMTSIRRAFVYSNYNWVRPICLTCQHGSRTFFLSNNWTGGQAKTAEVAELNAIYHLLWASNKHWGCRLNHKGPQTICCDRNVRTLGASQVCPFPPVAARCIVSLFHALDKIFLHFCNPLGSKIPLSVMEVGRAETQQHIPFDTTDRRKW